MNAPAVPVLALDVTYGERDAMPCAVCRTVLPEVTLPMFELETPDGEPLCRPCARRVNAPMAAMVAFVSTLVVADEAGNSAGVYESLRALQGAFEAYHEYRGTLTPAVAPAPARKPRTAPRRGRRSKRR